MKILPINNNIQYKQQSSFKAKFPKQDIKEFLKEVTNPDVDTLPQLYTMLDFIKNLPGEKASISRNNLRYQIMLDGKSLNNEFKYFCAFHALKDATVNHKNTLMKKESIIKRMSENEFITRYFNNSQKNIEDIRNLF